MATYLLNLVAVRRCQSEAQLQCPKCKELGMPKHISVFCSQDCFKAAWGDHKKVHKPSLDAWMFVMESGRARQMNMPEFPWTGSLRPHRYVLWYAILSMSTRKSTS